MLLLLLEVWHHTFNILFQKFFFLGIILLVSKVLIDNVKFLLTQCRLFFVDYLFSFRYYLIDIKPLANSILFIVFAVSLKALLIGNFFSPDLNGMEQVLFSSILLQALHLVKKLGLKPQMYFVIVIHLLFGAKSDLDIIQIRSLIVPLLF